MSAPGRSIHRPCPKPVDGLVVRARLVPLGEAGERTGEAAAGNPQMAGAAARVRLCVRAGPELVLCLVEGEGPVREDLADAVVVAIKDHGALEERQVRTDDEPVRLAGIAGTAERRRGIAVRARAESTRFELSVVEIHVERASDLRAAARIVGRGIADLLAIR